MRGLLEKCFSIALMCSLLLAFIMILGQLVGLIFGQSAWVIQSSEWLKQPTIILAAIFSAIAFILGYFPEYKETE